MNTDLTDIHAMLGIPADYAEVHKLQVIPEASTVVEVGSDMFERPLALHPDTATAWQQMRAAAMQDGVTLLAVSGYRSIAYQRDLIARKLARGQTIADILAVNAAPGFSEHHSGRALDIATAGSPVLEKEFEQTSAFAWLQAKAIEFDFHMSYPQDNPHGLMYEPWHWAHRT